MKVFVAGHNGLVGSAIARLLRSNSEIMVVSADRANLDLIDFSATQRFIKDSTVNHVYLSAAIVGGIKANNDHPVDFLGGNLRIQQNVIEACYHSGVERLLFLGSSCIYPKYADQPIREESLLKGPLEPTNTAYSIAKIAGVHLCAAYRQQFGADFRSVMPCNVYGPRDNYGSVSSHVLPALIRKFHEAKEQGLKQVVLWGDGSALREFIYSDDLASACIFVMALSKSKYEKALGDSTHLNVGTGQEVSIRKLAEIVKSTVGFKGSVKFDGSMPNGTPRKLLDSTRLSRLGWSPSVSLEDGIARAYRSFLSEIARGILVER